MLCSRCVWLVLAFQGPFCRQPDPSAIAWYESPSMLHDLEYSTDGLGSFVCCHSAGRIQSLSVLVGSRRSGDLRDLAGSHRSWLHILHCSRRRRFLRSYISRRKITRPSLAEAEEREVEVEVEVA